MKDFADLLESYTIAEEGLFDRFKKNKPAPKKKNNKISMEEYKSKYEGKVKRLLALCKSDLSKIFKDSELKICIKGHSAYSYDEVFKTFMEYDMFPSIPVIRYDYWKMYPNLRAAMREQGADEVVRQAYEKIIEMININAQKAGLSGKAVCGGDWDDGSFDFEINSEYNGIEKDNTVAKENYKISFLY